MDARFSIGSRRTFIKGVVGGVSASVDTLLKDLIFFPVVENLPFEIRQAQFVGYRFEHPANLAHRSVPLCLRGFTQGHRATEITGACDRYLRMRKQTPQQEREP